MRKVLIANRGKSRSGSRACRDAGLASVAVYEDAEFAQAVGVAGLTWTGPPPAAIRLLGDKISDRQTARQASAPLLPGMTTPASDAAQVAAFARHPAR